MKFETSSSINALVMNGKGAHVVNPWHIIVDIGEETITVRKRNAILIGVDEQVCAFKFIRNITIDQHLFGADIHIKVVGGFVSAFCIPKSDAKKIKNMLLEYNQTKKGKGIIFS
jgi:hypothetical protein